MKAISLSILASFAMLGLAGCDNANVNVSVLKGIGGNQNGGTSLSSWTVENGIANSSIQVVASTVDSSGNVYVTGTVSGGSAFPGNTKMGSVDLFLMKYDSSGVFKWTREFGVLSSSVVPTAITADVSGNIYLTGTTTAALSQQNLQQGAGDLFIIRYNPDGVMNLSVQDGAAYGTVSPQAILVDSSGNVFLTGTTNVGFDGQPLNGNSDYFVTEYFASTGPFVSVLGGKSGATCSGFGIAEDSSGGNIYIIGTTNMALAGSAMYGQQDYFIAKYTTSSRSIGWLVEDGASLNSVGYGTLSSGDSNGTAYLSDVGSGNSLLPFGYASNSMTSGTGIVIDSSGTIFVTGSVSGSQSTYIDTLPIIQNSAFVSEYTEAGNWENTKVISSSGGSTISNRINLDSRGNIYVAGNTYGSINGQTFVGTTGGDVFVVKYTSVLAITSTMEDGSAVGSSLFGLNVDSSGNIVIAGSTSASIDSQTAVGSKDLFAKKFTF